MPRPLAATVAALCTFLACATVWGSPAVGSSSPSAPAGVVARDLYRQDCAPCHGGDGEFVYRLRTKPGDFASGRYKFKTTAPGEAPLREDVFRSITEGIATTPMLPQVQLSDDEMWALVDYVLALNRRHMDDAPPAPLTIPDAPALSAGLVSRGRRVYTQMDCARCHGDRGRGDEPSTTTQTDAQGRSIQPRDLRYRPRKAGDRVEDLYRVFVGGLAGTPMPSFGGALPERDRWALATYVDSLGVKQYERGPLGSIGEEAVGLEIATRAAQALRARGGIRPLATDQAR
ncbi:MAG: cytochrome c [Candidatus Poribacteria bacterium]